MVQNELNFQKKRERDRKRKEKQHKLDLKILALKDEKPRKPVTSENHYFTGFVLNKDPSCTKYMEFDEVFFPKLFNKATQKSPPETIQSLWMLGFEDHRYRSEQPKTEHANTMIAMDTTAVASPSKFKEAKKKTKKKSSEHQFIAVYSNKPL